MFSFPIFSLPISQMLVDVYLIRGNYLTLGDRVGHQMMLSVRVSLMRRECLAVSTRVSTISHIYLRQSFRARRLATFPLISGLLRCKRAPSTPSNQYCGNLCSFSTLPAAAMSVWKFTTGGPQHNCPMLYLAAMYFVKRGYPASFISFTSN